MYLDAFEKGGLEGDEKGPGSGIQLRVREGPGQDQPRNLRLAKDRRHYPEALRRVDIQVVTAQHFSLEVNAMKSHRSGKASAQHKGSKWPGLALVLMPLSVLLLLLTADGAAWAQGSDCEKNCTSPGSDCWELRKGNQTIYQRCLAQCKKKCQSQPQPKPPVVPPSGYTGWGPPPPVGPAAYRSDKLQIGVGELYNAVKYKAEQIVSN